MDILILYVLTACLIWSIFFKKLFVARTRHELFLIRDKAFLTLEHDEEYYRFRKDVNMFIRFAERVSWQRIIYDTLFLFKHISNSSKQNIKLPKYNNKELEKYFLISMFLIGKLVVQKSIILYTLFNIFVLIELIKHYFKKQSDKVVDTVERKLFTPKVNNTLFKDARQSDISPVLI